MLRTTPGESIAYNSYRSTGIILQTAGDVGGSGLSLDLPDRDGDACAVYLVIGLVLLVFVLVIGSALIPHFWLFSGSILLGIMVLIAIHDLRIRPPLRSNDETESNTNERITSPDSTEKAESNKKDWSMDPDSTDETETNTKD